MKPFAKHARVSRGTSLFRGACVASLIVALASCGLLKKKDGSADAAPEAAATAAPTADATDAGPAASPVPSTPAAVVSAANEADVARFPDETAVENGAATLQRWSNVREAPLNGKVVASLNKGTAVTSIAQRDKYTLVNFDNPKDPTQKLMGWVSQDSFSPAPAVDAGPLRPVMCTAPDLALVSDVPFCGRVCVRNTDCPAGSGCRGSANKMKIDGKPGDPVAVCIAIPAPTTVLDAGGGSRVATIDAGKPAVLGDTVDPVGGKCAPNYALIARDGRCHKLCPNVADCIGGFCIKCDQNRVCSAKRDLCK